MLDRQGVERFDALHSWIGTHLAYDLSLPVLARQAGMSERSFSRHYAATTGQSPARAVEQLRVEAARSVIRVSWAAAAVIPAIASMAAASKVGLRIPGLLLGQRCCGAVSFSHWVRVVAPSLAFSAGVRDVSSSTVPK